jgi:lantibiotic modifying enzyme
MSAQTLSEAVSLIEECSSTLQALQTKTLQVAQGQSPFTPSELELFKTVLEYLLPKVDFYISGEETEELPDIYSRIFTSIYDDLATSLRTISYSTGVVSRHNSGLRVDSDRDITNTEYTNYIDRLTEDELDSGSDLDLEQYHREEFS